MSEDRHVEKPFLQQLATLGWTVVEHGPGIPTDPTISLRSGFRQTLLPEVFRNAVRDINRTEGGAPWLWEHSPWPTSWWPWGRPWSGGDGDPGVLKSLGPGVRPRSIFRRSPGIRGRPEEAT